MKRQRGRGRNNNKPAGNHSNRSFESSGPDLKIRGSAAHIYEKYLQLARDAHSSGDRVMAENYLQHAEHYFRILRAMQPQHVTPQFEQRFDQSYDLEPDEGEEGEEGEYEGEEEGAEMAVQGGEERPRGPQQQRGFDPQRGGQQHRGERQDRPERRPDRGDRPQQGGYPAQPQQQQSGAAPGQQAGPAGEGEYAGQEGPDGEGFRGRRRRRGRFRPGAGEGGERPAREGGGEQPSIEGFGDAAPAFLGGD